MVADKATSVLESVKEVSHIRLEAGLQASATTIDIMDCGSNSTYDFPINECRIQDRLQARLLLIRNQHTEVLWVSADECSFRRPHMRIIKDMLAEQAGLTGGQVLIAAIHNHSAHNYLSFDPRDFANRILDVLESLRAQSRPLKSISVREGVAPAGTMVNRRLKIDSAWGDIAVTNNDGCIVDLAKDKLDASGWLAGVLSEFGSDLQKEGFAESGHILDGPLDRRLHLWTLLDDQDQTIASIGRVNVHPVSVSIAKVGAVISADYVRPLVERIESRVGGVCLIFNGAFGNVRPLQSTYNFEECDRIGNSLAEAMLAASPANESVVTLSGSSGIVKFPIKDNIPHNTAQAEKLRLDLEQKPLPAIHSKAKRQFDRIFALKVSLMPPPPDGTGLLMAHELDQGWVDCEWQAWQLGPIRIVCIPGEPFVEQALAIEGKCEHLVIGNTNGGLSYMPDPESFSAGGYESNMCLLGKEALKLLPDICQAICGPNDSDAKG
jgi:hypothetical protein